MYKICPPQARINKFLNISEKRTSFNKAADNLTNKQKRTKQRIISISIQASSKRTNVDKEIK